MLIKKRGIFFTVIVLTLSCIVYAAEDQAFDLDPIVVHKSSNGPCSKYSLDYQRLNGLPFDSLVESLGLSPVDLQSRSLQGGIQSDFSMRGSTFQEVLVLVNSQRLNDPQTGHHNSDLPFTSEDIENINIDPGVNSAILGPDAIGGAISFKIKKPEKKGGVLEFRFGNHQTKSGLFSLSDKINKLGVRFSFQDQESAGFHEDTDYKNITSGFSASLEVPDGSLNTYFGYQDKKFGAYDFYTPNRGYPSKEWTRTYLLSNVLDFDRDGLIIKPGFLWRRHYDKFMLDKTQVSSNHHRTDMFTPNIYLQNQFDLMGRVGFGLEYGQEKITSTSLGKHSRNHESIFFDQNKEFTSRISLDLSGRYDHYDSFDKSYTGTVGIKYKTFQSGTLRFDISRSMRLPSFTELYYDDPTTLGDADLAPEKAINYQLGLDYQKKELFLGGLVFLRQEKNLIDWVKTSPSQAKWQAENILGSDVLGFEGSIDYTLNDYLKVSANYTYVNKRTNEDSYIYKYGQNYCRHLANAEMEFRLPRGKQVLSFSYKKKPQRRGWFIMDIHLAYNIKKIPEIFFNITNLFNVEYQEIEGIPQPGRYIEGGLRLEW